MEELLTTLDNFEVTHKPNNTDAEHPRFSSYKKKKSYNQEERRKRILEKRKE